MGMGWHDTTHNQNMTLDAAQNTIVSLKFECVCGPTSCEGLVPCVAGFTMTGCFAIHTLLQ